MQNLAAAEHRADRVEIADVLSFLVSHDRGMDAVSLARDAIRLQPARIPDIIGAFMGAPSSRSFSDPTSGFRESLQKVASEARARVRGLPREDAARAARALLNFEVALERRNASVSRVERLRAFMAEYSGTAEATMAEAELNISLVYPSQDARRMALEDYVRTHPGTVEAARTLYALGTTLQNAPSSEPRNADPTARFVKVVDIVEELESGKYPACQWVEQAPSLIVGFYAFQPRYTAENLQKVIEAYTRFLAKHFVVDDASPLGNSAGYVLTSKMAELFEMKGDPAGVDRTFATLEREAADPDAVKFLRAVYAFSGRKGKSEESERATLVMQSNRALADLAARGRAPWAQRALATLASQQFAKGDYRSAIESYRRYLTTYPRSDWAWVATVRMGVALSESGDKERARSTLRAAATTYATRPIARVVASALASEVSAAMGEFGAERADLDRALETWTPDYGPALRFNAARPSLVRTGPEQYTPEFVRADLAARSAALAASLARPGGSAIESGRWRLQHADWNGAIALLEPLTRDVSSPVSTEARVLVHRAQLERALARADLSQPAPDVEAADRDLKQLAGEPYDVNTAAASIARAALGIRQGLAGDARLWIRDGLESWRAHQVLMRTPVAGSVEEDVVAIRDVVFRPMGGGLYRPSWNGFTFPATLPPYLLARTSVPVKFRDGRTIDVAVNRLPPGLANVIFVDGEQEALLDTLMTRLGGTATREPGSPMETPNQPIGPSVTIIRFFDEFFPARQGHWSGWEFFAYPVTTSIEFRDAGRTKAAAAVTIGYAGCTVILEKRDDVWVALQLTNMWVT